MAYVSLNPPRTLLSRVADWYSRRSYGRPVDPVRAAANNPRVLLTYGTTELTVGRWNRLPSDLKQLAVMAAAGRIRCSWCMDFGYWDGLRQGVDAGKIRALPRWHETAGVYTPRERAVLAFAEAATATPPEVTAAVIDGLHEHLDDAQIVELAMMVALENLRSRFNTGVGLTSQGFKEECELTPVTV
ncbi:MAG: carboxymuconolactone decarboxylase family protein [Candidatus Dormibacteraeota bacterium]|nr:carboxymuconolactone decarboxylase family protein [Candidatus Dormibacteraeota bacterium]